jgi:hypothetical protein
MDIQMIIYEVIVIVLLLAECWLLWFYAEGQETQMTILIHHVVELKKKLAELTKRMD